MNKALTNTIEEIARIQRAYRDSYVVLPQEAIDKGFTRAVTINSNDCRKICLFDTLLKDCSTDDGGSITIHGNSFGPLNPIKYFSQKTRLLALLKEDYIEHDSFYFDNDRGGHDKADDFQSNDYYITYKGLFKMVNAILEKLEPCHNKYDDVIAHTAIVNVNPFPGLSIKKSLKNPKIYVTDSGSVDGTVFSFWPKQAKALIQRQIELLNPAIIISGGVLKLFLNPSNYFQKVRDGEWSVNGSIFGRKIEKSKIATANPDIGLYLDERGTIWIDDDHPSRVKDNHIRQVISELNAFINDSSY